MTALRGRVERAPEAGARPALAAPAGAKAEDVGDDEGATGVAPLPEEEGTVLRLLNQARKEVMRVGLTVSRRRQEWMWQRELQRKGCQLSRRCHCCCRR